MITPLTVIEAIKTDFLKSLSARLCTLLAARGYLKAIRIPGAKKQASALKKIFSQSAKASC